MLEKYADSFQTIYENFPDGKLFRISFDPLMKQFKLTGSRRDIFEEIREAFSVANDAAFFTSQYGYAAADRRYVINKFGYFAPGLLFDVLQWIKMHYGSMNIVAISAQCMQYINDYLTPLKSVLNGKPLSIVNLSEETGRNERVREEIRRQLSNGVPMEEISVRPYEYREYQRNAVEALLTQGYGRGLIEIPTSGGKSFIIANFIWNYHKSIDSKAKVLIFVPNTQLVEQFYKDLIDYGYDYRVLAKFTGGMSKAERAKNDVKTARIIIANRQYIFKNAKQLPKIDVLFCDEVHQCNAASSAEFIQKLDAKIKVGCSGTIPKEMFAYWNLLGMFGRVVYRENVVDLQAQGFVSKLKITTLDIFHRGVSANKNYLFNLDPNLRYHPDELGFSDITFNEAYNAEMEFYAKNSYELYSPVFDYLQTLDENILVLFDRIETGKGLYETARERVKNKTAFYIDGQTPIEERERVRLEFEKSGNNLLVGNVSILGTGINIKRLKHICFLISTKSYSRVIQSIGRTLRLHSTKNEAHLIDVVYNFKYSQKHYKERLKMYGEIYNKRKPDEVIELQI